MSDLLQNLTLIGIHLGVSLVLAFFFTLVSKTERKNLLLVYVLFFVATIFILFIPRLPIFDGLKFNWQGKFLSILMAIGFVYFLPFLTKEQAGFTFKINKSVWVPFIILTVVSVAFRFYESSLSEINTTKEYLLYQLTMPGLSEEPVFRGVMLGLLNVVFVARKNIFGASMGWGSLIQSVLFGVGHAVYFDEAHHLQFFTEGFIVTFTLGAFMTYLKEKGESIIPAILFHNIYNGVMPLVRLFV